MLKFLFFVVVAYFLYQFLMAVNWDNAFSTASHDVSRTANEAGSGIIDGVGNAFGTLKHVILP